MTGSSGTGSTIGVFDSGMGGLTVLRELISARAASRFVYLGDTARLPYGTKSAATVCRYALRVGHFLVARGIDRLVVACNTASALALDDLRDSLGVPVLGVVEPGAEVAARRGGPIGVLGTEATIRSLAYPRAIARVSPTLEVRSQACPLFVPLVEEGWTEGEVPRRVAERYLGELGPVRTLLLGCTHYPLLTGVLLEVAPGIEIIDSASAVAEAVMATCAAVEAEPEVELYVTDGAERFMSLGSRILGRHLGRVELVDV